MCVLMLAGHWMREHLRIEVECPWHGSKFDIKTGEPTKPPATRAVPKYEVKIDGDNILVRKQK